MKSVGFVFSFSPAVAKGAQKEGRGTTASAAVSYGNPPLSFCLVLFSSETKVVQK